VQRPADVLYRAEGTRQQQAVCRQRVIAKDQDYDPAYDKRRQHGNQRPKNFADNSHQCSKRER
jgi:hypothetical protein